MPWTFSSDCPGRLCMEKDMNRIDRLIMRAQPKPTIQNKLEENNPYIGSSFNELLDYLCPDSKGECRTPERHTDDWHKYMWALMDAPRE